MNILSAYGQPQHLLNTLVKFLVPRSSLPNLDTAPLNFQISGLFPPQRYKNASYCLKKDKSRDQSGKSLSWLCNYFGQTFPRVFIGLLWDIAKPNVA